MSDNTIPAPYEDLLARVLNEGVRKGDRTGTGTLSVFGAQLRYNLAESFPLITTKKVFTRGVIEELLWFLRGDTNAHNLAAKGVHIWDAWAGEDGELGPIYGSQWRSWPTPDGTHVDQILQALETIKTDPDSRRNIVSAWNVSELDNMALPPCHLLFQLYVSEGKLSLQVYQRSADLFLGVPFNIASYALLTHMFAQQAGLEVGELVWTGGDCHIYINHLDQVLVQLARAPRDYPQLHLRPASDLFSYTPEDIRIVGYRPHPALPAPVAV